MLACVNVLIVVLSRLCIRSERGNEAKTQGGLKMCEKMFLICGLHFGWLINTFIKEVPVCFETVPLRGRHAASVFTNEEQKKFWS